MGARLFALLLLVIASGCSPIGQSQQVMKIALLAPFEGRYREIGYEALYSARLAIADSGAENIDLLAIDDGGSVASALDRAQAIVQDEAIAMTLILGTFATNPEVQTAFGKHPVLIIGHWNSQPAQDNIFMLASSEIDSQLSGNQPADITAIASFERPFVGSELFGLKQIPFLSDDLSRITIITSASLPDSDFTQRYFESDQFAPQLKLLATLSYDATRLAIESIQQETTLHNIVYQGINGSIQFDQNGYWQNAPIHEYHYEDGTLVQSQ